MAGAHRRRDDRPAERRLVASPVKTKYEVLTRLDGLAVGARIAVDRRHLVDQLAIVGAVPGLVEVVLLVELLLLEIRQDRDSPAIGDRLVLCRHRGPGPGNDSFAEW